MRPRLDSLIAALALALAACAVHPTAPPTATATATATARAPATATQAPTATPTPPPTAPPSSTPEPTLPPTATPEPLLPLTVAVDAAREEGAFEKQRSLNVATGGYAPMANVNWFPGTYGQLTAIGIDMVRVDHLTDEAFYSVVWRDASGDLNFDFSRLDRVIVPILQHGMEPLMCISYKPEALEPRDQSKVPPANLDEWAYVVRTFVEHYRDLGYTGLTWEIWNEPDIDFFFQGSPEQYVELYAVTARAVREIDPTARIGGAADSSITSPGGKLRPLLAYVRAHPEVPLDFVSYHDYSDPDGDGLPPYTLSWSIDQVEALMAEVGLAPRDILVTEWNLTPNMTVGAGAATDTHVGASALAVKLHDLQAHPSIRRAFYFAPIEGYVPREIFSGDLGLLTVNGHRKAAYNLFEMISLLGDRRLAVTVEGENTEAHHSYALATRAASGQVAALIWNYWEQERTVDLSVANLATLSGGEDWRVARYLIDATHANYYHDYSQGLRGYAVGPSEALRAIDRDRQVGSDDLTERYRLPAHSVMLVTLMPASVPDPVEEPSPPATQPDNYAAERPVTAGSAFNGSGWSVGRLVDEITHALPDALGWSSDYHPDPAHTEWVQVDLEAPTLVDTVRLYPRDDLRHEGAGFPVDFAIQGAVDPDAWVDLVVIEGHELGRPAREVQTFTFAPGTYRYIRLVATRLGAVNDDGFALQLAELEIAGPPLP